MESISELASSLSVLRVLLECSGTSANKVNSRSDSARFITFELLGSVTCEVVSLSTFGSVAGAPHCLRRYPRRPLTGQRAKFLPGVFPHFSEAMESLMR